MTNKPLSKLTAAQKSFSLFATIAFALSVIAVFSSARDVSRYLHQQQLVQGGKQTTTTITDISPTTTGLGRASSQAWYVYYNFTDEQGNVHRAHYLLKREPSIGQTISIYYSTQNPDDQIPSDQLLNVPSTVAIDTFVWLLAITFWYITHNSWMAYRKQFQQSVG